MRAEAGITVEPPGRVAFAPVSPGPTDPAFAATLTDAMLQGVAWALLIATLNSGVTGTVTINRSEEHTSELQSLMSISYAVFCLKKKTHNNTKINYSNQA